MEKRHNTEIAETDKNFVDSTNHDVNLPNTAHLESEGNHNQPEVQNQAPDKNTNEKLKPINVKLENHREKSITLTDSSSSVYNNSNIQNFYRNAGKYSDANK